MDDSGQMFPGGNAGIARMITKTLIPDAIAGEASVEGVARGAVNFAALDRAGQTTRIRLNSTAVWVEHEGAPEKSEFVTIAYAREGKVYRVKARSAIMAGGCWTTKHIVRDLPAEQREAYGQFYRSPCLMANVAVRNWRFLYNKGIVGCRWFGGLGQLHQRATDGDVWAATGDDQSGFADGADDQTYLFVSRNADRTAGSARAIRNAGHAVCRI